MIFKPFSVIKAFEHSFEDAVLSPRFKCWFLCLLIIHIKNVGLHPILNAVF